MFQSTRPHGARRGAGGDVAISNWFQSTRPHGARRWLLVVLSTRSCFNPRARTGRDPDSAARRRPSPRFNPRARTGRDGCRSWGPRRRTRFNPRARTGRDSTMTCVHYCSFPFQSTRPHGARPIPPTSTHAVGSFNPRARTGRDIGNSAPHSSQTCFNPRARTGRDFTVSIGWFGVQVFQSTRPHGARLGYGLPQ